MGKRTSDAYFSHILIAKALNFCDTLYMFHWIFVIFVGICSINWLSSWRKPKTICVFRKSRYCFVQHLDSLDSIQTLRSFLTKCWERSFFWSSIFLYNWHLWNIPLKRVLKQWISQNAWTYFKLFWCQNFGIK